MRNVLEKEILRKAVYAKFVNEVEMTVEEIIATGVSPENAKQVYKSDILARETAAKARELVFEGAWLIMRANISHHETMKELGELPKVPLFAGKTAETIAFKLALGASGESFKHLIGATITWGRHMYTGECDDCTMKRCPVYKQLNKGTRIEIE